MHLPKLTLLIFLSVLAVGTTGCAPPNTGGEYGGFD